MKSHKPTRTKMLPLEQDATLQPKLARSFRGTASAAKPRLTLTSDTAMTFRDT